MKKLIALIGAVATAFGLYAVGPAKFATSFESRDAGVAEGKFTPGNGWTWIGDALDLLVYNGDAYAYGEDAYARRDEEFVDTDNLNYLKLETGTNTLVREVGGNVFLDQLVKFTGFEEPQTNLVDGAKIAVWMSGVETEGTEGEDGYIAGETNLYVTCAKVAGGKVEQVALKIAGEYKLDTWYRLTIKSLGSIYGDDPTDAARAGFIVYVDGHQVAAVGDEAKTLIQYAAEMTDVAKGYMAKGQLFPAVDTTDATFATVGYQGIGWVDDIILDSEGPEFAKTVEVTADDLAVENARVILVKQNGEPVEGDGPWTVKPGDILVSYAADGAFIVKNGNDVKWSWDGSAFVIDEEAEIEVVPAVAEIEGEYYETLEEALVDVEALLADGAAQVEVGILADGVEYGEFYSFSMGTIIVTKGDQLNPAGRWVITVSDESEDNIVTDQFGAMPEKQISVASGVEDGVQFNLSGVIYGNGRVDTLVEVDGTTTLVDALTIGETYDVENGAGAVLKTTVLNVDGNQITLVGKGKVISGTELTADMFTNEAEDLDISYDEGTKLWTAQIKQAPTTGFMVIIAGVEGEVYQDFADAVAAAPADATIKLLSDVEVSGNVLRNVNLTLDLNGMTLDAGSGSFIQVIEDATLTINGTNGTVRGRINVGRQLGTAPNYIADNGNLVINGGTYIVDLEGGQTVIHVNGSCDDCDVTINDAVITSTNDNGVQFNGKGTYAINNSTITGATAIYMKGGDLTIDEDSVITATKAEYTAPVANRNGSNPTGDAIVMDTMTGYKGEIALTVADGATITKQATGASAIRETITGGDTTTTIKIDAPQIADIALTDSFIAKVVDGTAQLPGKVAVVGTTTFTTLQAAVNAANAGDTVTLIADATDAVVFEKAGAFTLDLNTKTLTMTAGEQAAVKVDNAGADVTITGGNITIPQGDGFCVWARQGNVTIEDGNFTNDSNDDYCVYAGGGVSPNFLASSVTILGGTFNNLSAEQYKWNPARMKLNLNTQNGNEDAVIIVQGGTFSADPAQGDDSGTPASFVADGFCSFVNGDSLYEVAPAIAQVGDKTYPSLAAAVAAAADDDTITLLADTTDAVVFAQAGEFTLDLNDFALTMKSGEQAAVKVDNADANVTITGGAITIPQGAGFCVWARQGNVTIEDGYFTNDSNDDYCVYAGGGVSPNFLTSKVTINGGSFINVNTEGYKYNPNLKSLALNVQNGGKGVIEVKGGTFSADPAGGDDSTVPASFVADGYVSTYDEATQLYSVAQSVPEVPVAKIGDKEFSTLAAAFEAAGANDKVEMLSNVELDSALIINEKDVTFDLGGFTLKAVDGYTGDLLTVTNSLFEVTNGVLNVAANAVRFKTDSTVKIAQDVVILEAATYKFEVEGGTLNFYGVITNTQGEVPAIHTATPGSIINIYEGAEIVANGDTIRSNPTSGEATINIYGGTLTPGQGYPTVYAYNDCVTTFNVYGGTLNHPKTDAHQAVFGLKGNAVVTPLTDACTAKFGSKDGTGWSLDRTLADWCASGFAPVLGQDGYYTIQAVYNVTIAPAENGTVETSVTNNIVEGTEVTITATPATGYEIDTIAVTNGDAEVKVENNKFAMPAGNVKVYATFKSTAVPEDWEHPVVPIGETTTAAEAWPSLAEGPLAKANAGKLKKWAETQKVDFSVADEIKVDAFLLNCENTDAAVAEAKAAFKIPAITINGDTVTVTEPTGEFNGTIKIMGSTTVDGAYDHEKTTGDKFFKAVLSL